MNQEYQYLSMLESVLERGYDKGDRTGTGTISSFGGQMRFKLNDGKTFPLLTTKKVFWRGIVHELLWFISGDTNIKYLVDNGVHIWDAWANEDGELGPVYSEQWRAWKGSRYYDDSYGIDQLQEAIDMIKTNPNSRRIIVSAWNPNDLPNESMSPQDNIDEGKMALAACHTLFQFYVSGDKLSLHLYQRSADMFLGVPFNIASYALLLLMVARVTGYKAHEFIHTLGDYHVYNNHIDKVKEQLTRIPFDFPSVIVPEMDSIDDYDFNDIQLINYHSHSAIKGEVSV